MKVVLIQGAFDILNVGHIRAFKLAKAQGDYLIVALNSNELIKDYKNRDAVMPWHQKMEIIKSVRYVDMVIPAYEFSPLALLKQYNVDVYMVAPEWEHTKEKEIAFMKKKGGKVCFTKRYKGVSTTNIKRKLLREHLNGSHAIVA